MTTVQALLFVAATLTLGWFAIYALCYAAKHADEIIKRMFGGK